MDRLQAVAHIRQRAAGRSRPWRGGCGSRRVHDVKGQAIVAFVTLKESAKAQADIQEQIRTHVANLIGAIARPEEVYITADLPKTRSERSVSIPCGETSPRDELGDTSTLADATVVRALRDQYGGAV